MKPVGYLRDVVYVNKGDLPGHEFHGNQHTGGAGAAEQADSADSHANATAYHNGQAERFNREGKPATERAHREAAHAHALAAEMHEDGSRDAVRQSASARAASRVAHVWGK